MHKPAEDLLQFIWLNKLLQPKTLVTAGGKEIKVLKTGDLNRDAGPDFFNAQIAIDGIVLAGNVEVHVQTSDWIKHGHEQDANYNNLILHVVFNHDISLKQNESQAVEVLELKNYISKDTLQRFEAIYESKNSLPCEKQLYLVEDVKFSNWLQRMSVERLETKVTRLNKLHEITRGDLTQTFYTLLLRNFGFKVNALPFELLAKTLPVQLLLKHGDNLMQQEAMLLGQAGLLDEQMEDKYIRQLQNEYTYLKTKYQLKPLDKKIFKFSRMRPANFPSIRLAQFAGWLNQHPEILQNPHNFSDPILIVESFNLKLSGYWQTHYSLEGKKQDKALKMGLDSAQNILINTFAPFYFFYGIKTHKSEYLDLAIRFLEHCDFEKNTKTKLFLSKQAQLQTAAQSQACIELFDNYCSKKQCLQCGIAAAILKTG